MAACAQLSELTSAVDVAAENPARFNLTAEELSSRRRWIEQTQRQVRMGNCMLALVHACHWARFRLHVLSATLC